MRWVFALLGVSATTVLLIVSMSMNWRFGVTMGRNELDGYIYGTAGAASDVLKAVLPLLGLAAYRQRQWTGVLAAGLIWSVCVIYSLTSAFGFAALNRADVAAVRHSVAEQKRNLTDQLAQWRQQLSELPGHRPLAALKALIAAHQTRPRWTSTSHCTDVTADKSRTYCVRYHELVSEKAVAEKAFDIEKDIAALLKQLYGLASDAQAGLSDPQAALLATVTGRSAQDISTALALLLAVLTELGSSLGYLASLSPLSPPHRHKDRMPHHGEASCSIDRFFVEVIAHAPGDRVKASDLYEHFLAWCQAHKIQPDLSITAFGKWAADQGKLKKSKIGGHIQYHDIRLALLLPL